MELAARRGRRSTHRQGHVHGRDESRESTHGQRRRQVGHRRADEARIAVPDGTDRRNLHGDTEALRHREPDAGHRHEQDLEAGGASVAGGTGDLADGDGDGLARARQLRNFDRTAARPRRNRDQQQAAVPEVRRRTRPRECSSERRRECRQSMRDVARRREDDNLPAGTGERARRQQAVGGQRCCWSRAERSPPDGAVSRCGGRGSGGQKRKRSDQHGDPTHRRYGSGRRSNRPAYRDEEPRDNSGRKEDGK